MEFQYENFISSERILKNIIFFNYDNEYIIYHFVSHNVSGNDRKSNTCLGKWKIKYKQLNK